MMLSYSDIHSNTYYGHKENSLYERILYKLEAIENDGGSKRNVSIFENYINDCFRNDELSREEYTDLLSILERFSVDVQLSKSKPLHIKRFSEPIERAM